MHLCEKGAFMAKGSSSDPVCDASPAVQTQTKAIPKLSETQYRSVIEGSLQGIIIQQHGRIVYANAAMAPLFGFERPDQMIGLNPFDDLIADDDKELFRIRTAAVTRGEHVDPHPGWRAKRTDQKTVWVTSTAHLTEWQGQPAVTSFYMDITDRKTFERARNENEARYKSALKAGQLGAWESDIVNGTRIWTEEGLALFGLSLPDCRGQVGGDADELVAVIHPQDRAKVQHYYAELDSTDLIRTEYRILRAGDRIVWLAGHSHVVARTPDGRAERVISIMSDVTQRLASVEHIQFLLKEVSHRSKNLLAVIQAIARQTAGTAKSVEDYQERFGRRLSGIAASLSVIVQQDWRGAPITDIMRAQLAPFVDANSRRIVLTGPHVMLSADAAQSIGLAIHELATNALKHGALATASGQVRLSWLLEPSVHAPRQLRLSWIEEGGPAVSKPSRTGFGHVVLNELVSSSLNAAVTIDFAETGLAWRAAIPEANNWTLQPVAGV